MNSKSRKEKIEILKKLVSGKVQLQDIVPKIKLWIFETEPGVFEGVVLDGPPGPHVGSMISRKKSDIITYIKNKCNRYYPDHKLETEVIFFEEYNRLNEKLEQEY